jgi:hypothetical protein
LTVKIGIRDKSNVESDWIMLGVVLSGLAVLIITAIKNKGLSLFSITQIVEIK